MTSRDEREVPVMAQQQVDDQPGEPRDVPFNLASVVGRELDHVQDAVRSGHLSSGGTSLGAPRRSWPPTRGPRTC
jgi:hypothetical protein